MSVPYHIFNMTRDIEPRPPICSRGALVLPGERVDDLQNKGLKLIQRADAFCLGTDSVLLADFARVGKRERVIDLGTGTGVIALLLCAKEDTLIADACDIQPDIADMARRSMRLNEWEARVRVLELDMLKAPEVYGAGVFDHVVCNPPYSKADSAISSDSQTKRIARHEGALTLSDVCNTASKLLKYGGRFSVVFPAQRLFELMTCMQNANLAPKRVRNVLPNALKPPRVTLIDAVKGGGAQLHWLPPLILYTPDGKPSEEYNRIYAPR